MNLDQFIKIEYLQLHKFCKDIVLSFFMFFCEGSDDQYPSDNIMCMYVTFN
jgi:hypothetical protein